jgi:tetratricopeptide (TPR) repeat protein
VLLNELGSSYTEAGRFADAQASYREALRRFEAIGQGESSNAAIALNNLCGSLYLGGAEAEAADCARRSASLRDRLYGPSANSAAVRLLLGQILIAREDLPGALRELEQGLVTAQEFVGADSDMVQRLRLAKAQALIEAGRAADAEAQIAEVAAVLARTPDLGIHFQGLILVEQARLALHRQQTEQARALLDQAAPLVRAPHGNRRDDLATLERLQAQIVQRQTG